MFVSPEFLMAAAVGASIPLLLHLIQRRKRIHLPFPTIRFLQMAEKSASQKVRFENFLLWLLRTLIMALLGLAFAMPMIRKSGLGWLGNVPRDVAIVLDSSYSMAYRTENGSVWDKAIQAGVSILGGLHDGDRFCIFLAGEQPQALFSEPVADKQQGITHLYSLQPGHGSSRIGPAVNAAMKALQKANPDREHEIHILTDNQALPWRTVESDMEPLDSKTGIFVSLLGVPSPENTAIAGVDIQPPVVRKGSELKVTAHLLRTGSATDTTVSLIVDDREMGRRLVSTADSASPEAIFTLPGLEEGVHPARIQIPDDNLAVDNTFYFLLRVQKQLPTLIVGADADTLYLRTALRTGLGKAGILETTTPERLAEKNLSDYAGVILSNALPLFGQTITALESYVRAGGVLMIFPGARATPDAYTAWTCLPALPKSIEDLPLSQRNRTLLWDQPQHMLIRALREGIGVPAVAIRRHLAFDIPHEQTQRIISLGANQPFLLERPLGTGRVLLFAVSAERTWSDFPLSPFFLPMLVQCAESGTGAGTKSSFDWASHSLPLAEHLPGLKTAPVLSAPDGQPVSIRSSLAELLPHFYGENLFQPGFYFLTSAENPEGKAALAINLPREESALNPVPAGELPAKFGVENTYLSTDLTELTKYINEHRNGHTFGEQLLWVALALIVLEFLIANHLANASKQKPPPLDLTTDSSKRFAPSAKTPEVLRAG